MWRRLNREDLLRTAPHFLELQGEMPFQWYVYEEYELVSLGNQQYLRTANSNNIKHTYKPLEDSPHLFLEFARLVEHRDPEAALNEWISRRGLLGLHKRERPEEDAIGREAGLPRSYFDYDSDHWWTWYQVLTEYMHEGGPCEGWSDVYGEAVTANTVLTHWEVVLSGEPERAEQKLLDPFSRPVPEIWEKEQSALKERYIDFLKLQASHLGLTYSELLLHQVAFMACVAVQKVLEAFAFPYLAFDYRHSSKRPSGHPGPELVSGSWRPRNLLGAMYLQMYQVMVSSGKLYRCEQCGRIISYASPISGSDKARKPRKDKKFCDSRCRQNYHYHNRIKPRRQGF